MNWLNQVRWWSFDLDLVDLVVESVEENATRPSFQNRNARQNGRRAPSTSPNAIQLPDRLMHQPTNPSTDSLSQPTTPQTGPHHRRGSIDAPASRGGRDVAPRDRCRLSYASASALDTAPAASASSTLQTTMAAPSSAATASAASDNSDDAAFISSTVCFKVRRVSFVDWSRSPQPF